MYVRFLVLGLAFLLVLSAFQARSQSDIVSSLEDRHTPGFPASLDLGSLVDLIKATSPQLGEALSRILECDTLECLEGDTVYGRVLGELMSNLTSIDVKELRSMSDSDLLELVDDTSLRAALEALNTTTGLDPLALSSVLEAIEEARSKGSLSPQAYIAALELLKRILERRGEDSGWIERRQVEAVREALMEASRSGLLQEAIAKLGNVYAQAQAWSPSFEGGQSMLPKLRAPEASISLPRMSVDVLLLALVALLAAIAAFNAARLAPFLEELTGRRGALESASSLPLALKLYWGAVRLVERATGVTMSNSTTHREYLGEVSGKLGGLLKPFRDLTEAYELYRFAGVRGEELEAKARRAYNELAGGGGGA